MIAGFVDVSEVVVVVEDSVDFEDSADVVLTFGALKSILIEVALKVEK
jgi:hypothetical protein